MAMRRFTIRVIALVAAVSLAGCDSILGENKTPEMISWQVQGEAGTPVELIISKQFVAGVTEAGVTEVAVFDSDTVSTVLPAQGDLDVRLERRFFMQVATQDTITGRVNVSVDGRSLLSEQGDILPESPFRFVYVFNQTTTRIIEVF